MIGQFRFRPRFVGEIEGSVINRFPRRDSIMRGMRWGGIVPLDNNPLDAHRPQGDTAMGLISSLVALLGGTLRLSWAAPRKQKVKCRKSGIIPD